MADPIDEIVAEQTKRLWFGLRCDPDPKYHRMISVVIYDAIMADRERRPGAERIAALEAAGDELVDAINSMSILLGEPADWACKARLEAAGAAWRVLIAQK